MSDESNKILQKLGDELGHITLIADWVERTKKELAEGTLQVGGTLTGHGAGAPPALAPAEEPAPVVSVTEPAPAAPAEAPVAKEDVGDGNTAPPATSAPSEAPAAPAQDAAPPADGTSAG